ncbi:hypothetical protein E3Q12_01862 [Wallemia mellicola]|nr:hypothetical protein E3Q12_01862 [Wallemia mellicola]
MFNDDFGNELFRDGADDAYDTTYQEQPVYEKEVYYPENLRGADKQQVSPETASQLIRRTIAQEAQHVGFERATEDAMIEIERHAVFCIESLAKMTMEYAQNAYRTEATLHEVCEAFNDVGMTPSELNPVVERNKRFANVGTLQPTQIHYKKQFVDPTHDFLPSDDEQGPEAEIQAEAAFRMSELATLGILPMLPPRHSYHRTAVYPTPHRTQTPLAHLDRKQNTSRLVERALKSLIERTQVATESSLMAKNQEALAASLNDDEGILPTKEKKKDDKGKDSEHGGVPPEQSQQPGQPVAETSKEIPTHPGGEAMEGVEQPNASGGRPDSGAIQQSNQDQIDQPQHPDPVSEEKGSQAAPSIPSEQPGESAQATVAPVEQTPVQPVSQPEDTNKSEQPEQPAQTNETGQPTEAMQIGEQTQQTGQQTENTQPKPQPTQQEKQSVIQSNGIHRAKPQDTRSGKPPWLQNIQIDANILKELPLEFGIVNFGGAGETLNTSSSMDMHSSTGQPSNRLVPTDDDASGYESRVKRRRWKV